MLIMRAVALHVHSYSEGWVACARKRGSQLGDLKLKMDEGGWVVCVCVCVCVCVERGGGGDG